MSKAYDDYESRVRQRAHAIWEREGKPEGQADAHWALAREEVSTEENLAATLKPNSQSDGAEPLLAVDGLADIPGRLSDQGERQDYPALPERAAVGDKAASEGVASRPKSDPRKRKRA